MPAVSKPSTEMSHQVCRSTRMNPALSFGQPACCRAAAPTGITSNARTAASKVTVARIEPLLGSPSRRMGFDVDPTIDALSLCTTRDGRETQLRRRSDLLLEVDEWLLADLDEPRPWLVEIDHERKDGAECDDQDDCAQHVTPL